MPASDLNSATRNHRMEENDGNPVLFCTSRTRVKTRCQCFVLQLSFSENRPVYTRSSGPSVFFCFRAARSVPPCLYASKYVCWLQEKSATPTNTNTRTWPTAAQSREQPFLCKGCRLKRNVTFFLYQMSSLLHSLPGGVSRLKGR